MNSNLSNEEELSGLTFNLDHPNPGIHRVRRSGFRLFRTFSIRRFDFLLVIMILSLNTIGILAIGSAEPELQIKQLYGMIISVVLMILIAGADYHKVLKFYWVFYAFNILLLLAVRLFGSTGGGAQRWVKIGPVTFQPSESAKILLILFFAQFIMRFKDKIRTFPMVAACVGLVVPPLLLVLLQPDLSTTIMLFIIFCVIMFVGGISWKLVTTVLVIAIPSVVVLFNLILQDTEGKIVDDYQRLRVLAWLHPENYADSTAYQTMNSMMAIGSGRLLGKGYNTNEISSLLNSGYISESQTDFIFTVIGEEFGFVGTVCVVILLVLIAIELLRVAANASDLSGRIIASGAAAWIGFQGFLNIGVATGMLPNTGIPLPFVSYGLTSLLSLYVGLGFVLNVNMQRRKR